MAAVKVRNLWTACITAFFAVLAALGLAAPATAAGRTASAPSAAPSLASAPAAEAPSAVRALVPRPMARGRSLPPTIKQRISAEAHGSSPSVRRIPADTASGPLSRSAARDLLVESALASAA